MLCLLSSFTTATDAALIVSLAIPNGDSILAILLLGSKVVTASGEFSFSRVTVVLVAVILILSLVTIGGLVQSTIEF